MSYDPKTYWETRENPNAPNQLTAPQFIYDYVRPRLALARNVLEVGPGLGRTLDLYTPEMELKTIDLSTNYRDMVSKRAKDFGLSLSQCFLELPEDQFPFDDREFDIGVSIQVLMHVPPETVEITIGEICRTCERAVLIATVSLPENRKAAHVFEHDFISLIQKAGREVIHSEIHGHTGCFTMG
ncbi:class I SAM-dependent methyltransferase [Nioella sp.]|uniref:class I SAM-dependent methyltransferase n=1 Tax=Nioella sp. TaxID=1912091 RepID=UPI003A874F67